MRDGLIDELVDNWLLLDIEEIEDVARVNKFDLHKDPTETDSLMEKCLIIACNKKRGD